MQHPVDDIPVSGDAAPRRAEPPLTTRFAPSPTGYMHLGHAYSALIGLE